MPRSEPGAPSLCACHGLRLTLGPDGEPLCTFDADGLEDLREQFADLIDPARHDDDEDDDR